MSADQIAQLPGSLSLNIDSSSYNPGNTFNVKSNINTGGQPIIGYVVRITFDPEKVELVNDPPVTPGTLMSTTTDNVFIAPNIIRFGQQSVIPFTGTGLIGKIAFRAKTSGSAVFDYYKRPSYNGGYGPSNTGDCDLIISGGDDILGSTSNATITITGATVPANPPPANPPTVTPPVTSPATPPASTPIVPVPKSTEKPTVNSTQPKPKLPAKKPIATTNTVDVNPIESLSLIILNKETASANGKDEIIFKITVKDALGNIITNKEPALSVTGTNNQVSEPVLKNNTWEIRLISTTAESKSVSVLIDDIAIGTSRNVTFRAPNTLERFIDRLANKKYYSRTVIYTIVGIVVLLILIFPMYLKLKYKLTNLKFDKKTKSKNEALDEFMPRPEHTAYETSETIVSSDIEGSNREAITSQKTQDINSRNSS